jgi:threonine dehydrogenase-like Zn-dependent dehydrogenase
MTQDSKSRREFLKVAAAGAASLGASSSATSSTIHALTMRQAGGATGSALDTIQVGLIGAGGQGMSDAQTALRVPGVEIVAVADVYDGRLTRAKEMWGDAILTTRDYHEVLARADVDAAITGTLAWRSMR